MLHMVNKAWRTGEELRDVYTSNKLTQNYSVKIKKIKRLVDVTSSQGIMFWS